jgi:hypothetical protein
VARDRHLPEGRWSCSPSSRKNSNSTPRSTLVYRFSLSSSLKNTGFMRLAANYLKPHVHCHANQLILFDI